MVAAIVFLASLPVEVFVAPGPGLALRAAVSGVVLVWMARLWRRPSLPGLHRSLIWTAAWLLPTGYAVAALHPTLRSTSLHIVFLGSFALMALSVSLPLRPPRASPLRRASAPRPCVLDGRPASSRLDSVRPAARHLLNAGG